VPQRDEPTDGADGEAAQDPRSPKTEQHRPSVGADLGARGSPRRWCVRCTFSRSRASSSHGDVGAARDRAPLRRFAVTATTS
jgi:hypothetical protein